MVCARKKRLVLIFSCALEESSFNKSALLWSVSGLGLVELGTRRLWLHIPVYTVKISVNFIHVHLPKNCMHTSLLYHRFLALGDLHH